MKISIVGCGKIGLAIAELLINECNHELILFDIRIPKLKFPKTKYQFIKIEKDVLEIEPSIKDSDIIICATPYFLNKKVAKIALKAQVHYLDLSEDVENFDFIQQLADKANSLFIPQCGLAPGFINILASSMMNVFESTKDVKLRVGALPQYPNNKLKYNLTWSTEGLINEYGNLCHAIVANKLMDVKPLEGLETFNINGTTFEAFNTSGGLGSMADSYMGKVENLNYKSIRYPGHCNFMQLLMNELNFNKSRGLFKDILNENIPFNNQDQVIAFCNITGIIEGRLEERTKVFTTNSANLYGRQWSAIELTTAAGCCSVVELIENKKISSKGLVRQEHISFENFSQTQFFRFFQESSHQAVIF